MAYQIVGAQNVKIPVGQSLPTYDPLRKGYITEIGFFMAPDPSLYTVREVPDPITYPKLDASTFYMSFSPDERMAINELVEAKADKVMNELWRTYVSARDNKWMIDPNLPSLLAALEYMALSKSDGGLGILTQNRIPEILAGKTQ